MTHAVPIPPVACRSFLLLWLLSGLVNGFLVAAPYSSEPRNKHAAQIGGAARGRTRGGVATSTLKRERGFFDAALTAVAKGVAPEEEVGLQGMQKLAPALLLERLVVELFRTVSRCVEIFRHSNLDF